jgi:tetratricopeptide (TPR) repeat protein
MITLAMLVGPGRDAETLRAVESARPFVDKFAFTIWGGPADLVEPFGETCRYRGKSFADARQMTLQFAARKSSIVVMLDTDDLLVGDASAWRAWEEAGPKTGAWLLRSKPPYPYFSSFVWVGPIKGRWIGRTHECFISREGWAGQIDPEALQFTEQREKTREEFAAKAKRDIPLLLEEAKEKPNDGRWPFYLGESYLLLGETDQAIASYAECQARRKASGDGLEQGAWAAYKAARVALDSGFIEDYRGTVTWMLGRGMALDPTMPELPYAAAFVEYKCGRYRQSLAWAKMAIAIGCVEGDFKPRERTGFSDPNAWFAEPYRIAAAALHELGDTGAAESFGQRAEVAERMKGHYGL